MSFFFRPVQVGLKRTFSTSKDFGNKLLLDQSNKLKTKFKVYNPGLLNPQRLFKPGLGTYQGQLKMSQQRRTELLKKGIQPRRIEVDHITPVSLHLQSGQERSKGEGGRLSRNAPSAGLDELMHRRKLTTGSSTESKHHRRYLSMALKGMVPFAGPMRNQKDFNAAAMEIDIRGTATQRTLFGQPDLHDPRQVKSSQKGVVPGMSALRSLYNIHSTVHEAFNQGRIGFENAMHLHGVVKGEMRRTLGEYVSRFKPHTGTTE